MLLSGYTCDTRPADMQEHVEGRISHIAGIHFILATISCSVDPVVLIGLTEQAAICFASIADMVVGDQSGWQSVEWQVLSADAVR